jgi:cell division protein FtsB
MSARAYRVGPRRRSGGTPASRIHWDRLGRVILVLVLIGIMASYIGPAISFVSAWHGSHTERSELQSLSREHTRLVAKAASVSKSGAAAEEARRMGMIASGESAFVIKTPHR